MNHSIGDLKFRARSIRVVLVQIRISVSGQTQSHVAASWNLVGQAKNWHLLYVNANFIEVSTSSDQVVSQVILSWELENFLTCHAQFHVLFHEPGMGWFNALQSLIVSVVSNPVLIF